MLWNLRPLPPRVFMARKLRDGTLQTLLGSPEIGASPQCFGILYPLPPCVLWRSETDGWFLDLWEAKTTGIYKVL